MAAEDAAVDLRLRRGEHAVLTTETTAPRALTAFMQLCTAVDAGSAESSALSDQVLRHIDLLDFQVSKLAATRELCAAEAQYTKQLHADIDSEIASTRADIDALRATLQGEHVRKRQRLEYEALASLVNKLPTASETRRLIGDTRSKFEQHSSENASTVDRLQERRQQFALLMQCIRDLKTLFAEDAAEGLL